MSQEIDQRVVEMRFDNTQFEKNSRDTMRTLDKLKEKLSFKGAAKGLEQVQAASENVDFSGMEKGLDTVQAKFSALDVVAFTALQRITDKVISTGEQMVKSLSVDQITSGWDKYNEKTSNVQTIMNATGKSIDQVNGYLNKLMWYSDETSYGRLRDLERKGNSEPRKSKWNEFHPCERKVRHKGGLHRRAESDGAGIPL